MAAVCLGLDFGIGVEYGEWNSNTDVRTTSAQTLFL